MGLLNLKTILLVSLIAISLTIAGFPFGVEVEKRYTPGTIGVDYHISVTFLSHKIIDLGHFGYPGSDMNGYVLAFAFNGIFAYLIALILLPKFK